MGVDMLTSGKVAVVNACFYEGGESNVTQINSGFPFALRYGFGVKSTSESIIFIGHHNSAYSKSSLPCSA
jgi:hypothetical protein